MSGNVKVDIGAWLKEAFDLYKNHFTLLLLANLIAGLLSAVTLGILAGPLGVGVIAITLAALDQRTPLPTAGDVFQGMKFFLPAFLVVLMAGGAIFLGVLVCQLSCVLSPASPLVALAISTATLFALPLVYERRLDAWAAVKTSFEMAKPSFWLLLAYVLVFQFAAGLGMIACVIGVVFTAPFAACAIAVAYRKFAPAGSSGASEAEALVRVSPPPA